MRAQTGCSASLCGEPQHGCLEGVRLGPQGGCGGPQLSVRAGQRGGGGGGAHGADATGHRKTLQQGSASGAGARHCPHAIFRPAVCCSATPPWGIAGPASRASAAASPAACATACQLSRLRACRLAAAAGFDTGRGRLRRGRRRESPALFRRAGGADDGGADLAPVPPCPCAERFPARRHSTCHRGSQGPIAALGQVEHTRRGALGSCAT
mmetsp:Transcript_35633/g.113464  ORF Transcript_35633/g.113464 Transcript_35633/m.113464 type:complete len:210 (+) Transcript_35633:1623-2252(+)